MKAIAFTACCTALIGLLCGPAAVPAAEPQARSELNIPAQPLRDALTALGRQTGLQVVYTANEVAESLTAPRLVGSFSPGDALAKLLSNTGLRYEYLDERTIAIRTATAGKPPAGAVSTSRRASADTALQLARVDQLDNAAGEKAAGEGRADSEKKGAVGDSSGIPEILVKGARSSNADIRRTEDDVQPYVVFDAEEIGRSMAPDLETFLKTRLPMNQSRASEGQNTDGLIGRGGNQSTVDLRGLGADQTLILVNGRRMPGVVTTTDFNQPDINGIPISAVERIEVLPSTAGGIYGGGATGGVVNIILKRDYNDLELTARYDGTFAGGGAERRLDATAGFTLEDGRTHVMITGSYRDGNPLYVGDRDIAARSRTLLAENGRAAFVDAIDPVMGYTTNIRSADGSDLVLLDGRELGSPIAHVPVGYAGPGSDNGAAFLGTADEYNLMLPNDVTGRQYAMLNAPTVRSVQLNLRRAFSDHVEVFVDAARYDNLAERTSRVSAFNLALVELPAGPNNPFAQAVNLMMPVAGYEWQGQRLSSRSLSEQLGGGMIVRLPREWTVQGEYSLGRSNSMAGSSPQPVPEAIKAALIDGRLDPLRDVNAYPLDFAAFYPDEIDVQRDNRDLSGERTIATLRASGPLLRLPGGPLRLSALLERREQFTGDRVITAYFGGDTPTFYYYPEIGSSTESAYAELNAPLISAANARPGLLGLDLRASYRYDITGTRTSTLDDARVSVPSPEGPYPDDVPFQTNKVTANQYTLGFRYTPVESMALRLSYGEGILPPVPSQLSEGMPPSFLVSILLLDVLDPQRGSLPVDTTALERMTVTGSLLLRPEQSASWSGGMIFTPADLPGFRLSVDYTRIEKINEISSLPTQVLFDLEDEFSGRIVRNGLTAADAALGYTGGKIRELNVGMVNIARSLVEAVDIQADYRWETRLGSLSASILASVQPRLSQQITVEGEETNTVGYRNGPLKWRGNAGLHWSRGSWELGWNMQYYDTSLVYTSTASTASRDALVRGNGSALIPAQTYHDVYGRYRFGSTSGLAGGLLENTELQVSVRNVFDTMPPILPSNGTAGNYASEGDPRLRRYSIAFTKRFGR